MAKISTMAAGRRLGRSARSMATRVWTPAPVMWGKMKSILSHRRRRKVAKHAKPWGPRSCRRMQGSLLPLEIVATILSRLPVKSLLRFRCVCKEWHTLTYNPNFIKEHHICARALGRVALISRRTSPKMLLYDFGDNGEVRDLAFNMRFGDLNGYTVSNPVNGLICCSEYCHSHRCDEGNHYLLNPATRELAKLPMSRNGPRDKCTCPELVFDGFTGGYKLVKLFHIEGCLDQCGCEVLELGTQEWREVGRPPCIEPINVPVHLNGALHWISWWFPTANRNFAELTIVAFNHKDENFRLIPVPQECTTHIDQVYLVEWEGLLCLVKLPYRYRSGSGCASERDRRYLVIIWRLEDYATCRWREAHCSRMSNYVFRDGRLVVVGVRGHEILLVLMEDGGLGSICSYDLRTRNLCKIYHECPSGLLLLTESLVSPRYLAGNPSLE